MGWGVLCGCVVVSLHVGRGWSCRLSANIHDPPLLFPPLPLQIEKIICSQQGVCLLSESCHVCEVEPKMSYHQCEDEDGVRMG